MKVFYFSSSYPFNTDMVNYRSFRKEPQSSGWAHSPHEKVVGDSLLHYFLWYIDGGLDIRSVQLLLN